MATNGQSCVLRTCSTARFRYCGASSAERSTTTNIDSRRRRHDYYRRSLNLENWNASGRQKPSSQSHFTYASRYLRYDGMPHGLPTCRSRVQSFAPVVNASQDQSSSVAPRKAYPLGSMSHDVSRGRRKTPCFTRARSYRGSASSARSMSLANVPKRVLSERYEARLSGSPSASASAVNSVARWRKCPTQSVVSKLLAIKTPMRPCRTSTRHFP
jgi:hypothetical protein